MTTHDLREVTILAELTKKPENFSPEKTEEALKIAEIYRKGGFKKIADEIDINMNRKLKLARIAEFEYKVLRKEHFEKWLNGLKFPSQEQIAHYYISFDYGMSEQLLAMNTTYSNQINGNPTFNQASLSAAIRQLSGNKISYYMTAGDIIARRKENVRMDGREFEIQLKEITVENYQMIPPIEVVEQLNKVKDNNLFDTYVVIYPTAKEIVRDPLLCGKINEEPGQWFFIAEWGDDIRLDQLLN